MGFCRTLPTPPPSPYAEEGTRAHELAEKILRKWLEGGMVLDQAWVDSLRPEYADTETGDGWSMVDYVMTYVHFCMEKVAEFDPKPVIRLEVRLTLDKEKALFGTVDFCLTGTKKGRQEGLIVDLKYGKGVAVNAEGNPQLAYYACAMLQTSKRPLEAVTVSIVQPRVEEWFTEAVIPRYELEAWRQKLLAGADKALWQMVSKKYELAAGGHCRFCTAVGVCGTHHRYLSEQAGLDFAEASPPAPLTLSPERLARILDVRDEVRQFLLAAERHAMATLLDGGNVPGYKVVEGRKYRRWSGDDKQVAMELVKRGLADPYERRLKGITAVEKELGRGKIDDLTMRPVGPPTLARLDDKRAQIRQVVGEEFADG